MGQPISTRRTRWREKAALVAGDRHLVFGLGDRVARPHQLVLSLDRHWYQLFESSATIPRYAGRLPVSVLAHLYATYLLVREETDDPVILLQALTHDLHEAIVGEVPCPAGDRQRKDLERQVLHNLWTQLGLPLEMHEIVREADRYLPWLEMTWGGMRDDVRTPAERAELRSEFRALHPATSVTTVFGLFLHLRKEIADGCRRTESR